ncbi:hypothetical protein AW27_015720 [Streptomyces sp. PCS3-D2]|uniref:hypothetical protein n=1 Tax=Streptomyces sp. PCS3-D2 TaxID=1460244 RepID=UPI00272C1663|nr:hypothetical protein [Streptomyces sp. PCS3-D2]WKV72851.1 hypothetical protein AW27_015720 [Streptomyces sp. PCS3-D2]
MTLKGALRARRSRRLRRSTDLEMARLRADLDRLGYGWWPVPARVRVALRRAHAGQAPWVVMLLASLMLGYSVVMYFAMAVASDISNRPVSKWAWVFAASCPVLAWVCGRSWPYGRVFVRNLLTLECMAVIHACAEAYAAGHDTKAHKLREVSASLRRLEANVMQAYGRSGRVPPFSPRRRELRTHGGQVVAKLREAEAELDHGQLSVALGELAGLAATIAEQYAAGHIGALLPKTALEGRKPARDRELVHVAAAVLLIAGGVVGLSFLGLPDMATAAAATEVPPLYGCG